jgi:NIMA (never in mitosis gene a)-related kinase
MYIVTEFCEGGDLHGYIGECRAAGKTISEDQVLDWLVQLAMALQHVTSFPLQESLP